MPNHRPFGPPRSRRAHALRMTQPVKASTPSQIANAALRAEAAATWASATGLPASGWIGPLDPHVEPLIAVVLDALRGGAAVSTQSGWVVVTAGDGRRLVLDGDLLRSVLTIVDSTQNRPHE